MERCLQFLISVLFCKFWHGTQQYTRGGATSENVVYCYAFLHFCTSLSVSSVIFYIVVYTGVSLIHLISFQVFKSVKMNRPEEELNVTLDFNVADCGNVNKFVPYTITVTEKTVRMCLKITYFLTGVSQ